MHYKNGREAKEGDFAITMDNNSRPVAGVVTQIVQSETCNCTVVIPIVGGTEKLTCRTLALMHHVQDAFEAIEPLILADSSGR